MNISLLNTISSGNVGTKPTAILKPVKASPVRHSDVVHAGNVLSIRTGETITSDNSPHIAQKQPVTESSKNFSRVLVKKMKTKTSPNTQADIVQGILNAPVALDKGSGAKTLNRLQQQAKTLLKPEIISPDALQNSLIKKIQPENGENTGKMRISDKALAAGGKLLNQENVKEPTSKMLPLVDKMTITTEKPIMTDQPVSPLDPETTVPTKPVITSTFLSSRKNQQSSKQSTSETLISDNKTDPNNEHLVVINKLPVSDNSITPPTKTPVVALSDKSSRPLKKISIGRERPRQVLEETTTGKAVEQTTPNKADTNTKDHRDTMKLFELSEKNKAHIGNLPAKSITQKTNSQLAQVSASQAENHKNLPANQYFKPDMELTEHILAGNSDHSNITKQSSPSSAAPFVNSAGNADSNAVIGEQIQESIHNSFRTGSRQIHIRLNPPELGRVAIKFAEQNNEITGLMQVDKPQTRDQVQQALPEIIQNLQNSGITIKRFEVVLTGQQEQHTFKDQSSTAGQDSFSGQQSAPTPESQGNNLTYNEWMANTENGTQFNETQAYITDKSVNMLV